MLFFSSNHFYHSIKIYSLLFEELNSNFFGAMGTNNGIRLAVDFFCIVDMKPLFAMRAFVAIQQLISAAHYKIQEVRSTHGIVPSDK